MVFTIPQANGLAQELSERVNGIINIVKSPLRMVISQNKTITRLDLLVDGTKIGTIEVTSYTKEGIARIARLEYSGKIPGYVNRYTKTDQVTMLATESPTYLRYISDEHIDLSTPNNTATNPLYRQDGHHLRFADYEIKVITPKKQKSAKR
ncbi:hypothetical protein HYX04_04490 [Candidatus Woesearchaeota archaeon]|nr:hypothetical protein [Candidatus Woesearchaeota archaeon]